VNAGDDNNSATSEPASSASTLSSGWFLQGTAATEIWTDEGCYITELLNHEESPDLSVAIARVPPGIMTQLHRLSAVKERYIISQGNGVVEVDGYQTEVAVGDTVLIPAGTTQRIHNNRGSDLIFYCVCTPRFTPECYEALSAVMSQPDPDVVDVVRNRAGKNDGV